MTEQWRDNETGEVVEVMVYDGNNAGMIDLWTHHFVSVRGCQELGKLIVKNQNGSWSFPSNEHFAAHFTRIEEPPKEPQGKPVYISGGCPPDSPKGTLTTASTAPQGDKLRECYMPQHECSKCGCRTAIPVNNPRAADARIAELEQRLVVATGTHERMAHELDALGRELAESRAKCDRYVKVIADPEGTIMRDEQRICEQMLGNSEREIERLSMRKMELEAELERYIHYNEKVNLWLIEAKEKIAESQERVHQLEHEMELQGDVADQACVNLQATLNKVRARSKKKVARIEWLEAENKYLQAEVVKWRGDHWKAWMLGQAGSGSSVNACMAMATRLAEATDEVSVFAYSQVRMLFAALADKETELDNASASIVTMESAFRLIVTGTNLKAKTGECEDLRKRKDGAYLERNSVVALLASLADKIGWPVCVTKTAIEGWDPEWHNCVYIQLPTGQVSWHFHDDHAVLFAHLPVGECKWDGHETFVKYVRVSEMARRNDGSVPSIAALAASEELSEARRVQLASRQWFVPVGGIDLRCRGCNSLRSDGCAPDCSWSRLARKVE